MHPAEAPPTRLGQGLPEHQDMQPARRHPGEPGQAPVPRTEWQRRAGAWCRFPLQTEHWPWDKQVSPGGPGGDQRREGDSQE